MSKLKVVAASLVTLATGAILAACGNNNANNSTTDTTTLNTSTANEISTLDSSKYGDTTSSEILQNSMEGLYRFDKNNKVQLAGASSVTRSKDQKVYTFTLRKDAKWSNGDPVVAQDYVTGWQRTVDPKNESLDSDSYAIIKNGDAISEGKLSPSKLGIKAIGKYKLQITLENPVPYLPQILEGAQFYPQDTKLVKKYGSKYGTSSDKIAYNGPFVVKGWTGSNLKWSLKKNNTYWNKKTVHLNTVNYQVVKETSTGINMFQSNEIAYTPLSSSYVKQYRNNKEYHSQVTPTNGYMSFNLKRKVSGNVHVRRAISQAINKKQLVNNILFAGKVSNGIVASNFITDEATGNDYRKDAGDLVTYNLTAARKEWKKAQKELGKKITIELLTSDITDSKAVGEFLQSNLMENLPGLTVKVRSMPLKSRLANTTSHNYDMVYGTWQPSYEDPIDFLTLGGLFNLTTDYHNDNFWNQIENARSKYATNPKKRLASLIAAENQLIKKDAFAVPLYQSATSYLLKSNVKNFQLSPYGNVVYYWNTYIKN